MRNKDIANSDILFALNSAINSVVTATLLCWGSNYGFFKFYWVITKWILTTGLIIFGTFWLFPWGNTAEEISFSEGLEAFKNPIYLFDARGVLIGSLIQISFLLIIIAISTFKPWGRRTVK